MYPNDPIETIERDGLTARLYPDPEPMSPAEWDNLGRLVFAHARDEYTFATYVSTGAHELPVYMRAERMKGNAVIPIVLRDFGSGGMTLTATDEIGANGYMVATREDIDAERALDPDWTPDKTLRAELEAWNQYVSGDVYGYTVTDESGEVIDSLWGLYGYDYALAEMDSALTSEAADTEARIERLEAGIDAIRADAEQKTLGLMVALHGLRARLGQ